MELRHCLWSDLCKLPTGQRHAKRSLREWLLITERVVEKCWSPIRNKTSTPPLATSEKCNPTPLRQPQMYKSENMWLCILFPLTDGLLKGSSNILYGFTNPNNHPINQLCVTLGTFLPAVAQLSLLNSKMWDCLHLRLVFFFLFFFFFFLKIWQQLHFPDIIKL